jgi:hypothetical protein
MAAPRGRASTYTAEAVIAILVLVSRGGGMTVHGVFVVN